MKFKPKRSVKISELVSPSNEYDASDAFSLLKKCPKVAFDESVECYLKLNIDVKKPDQQLRGVISLPHGIGKVVRVLVFARGESASMAKRGRSRFCRFG